MGAIRSCRYPLRMTIWIDADASPRDVKDIVFRASARLEIPTVLVANSRMETPAANPLVTAVRVGGGPDVADQYIADESAPGDIAITADIPLASQLVEKGVITLDPRGEIYTKANIGERLSIRDFMQGLRDTGVETGGPKAYGQREKQAFANALDRTLTAELRRQRRSARRTQDSTDTTAGSDSGGDEA